MEILKSESDSLKVEREQMEAQQARQKRELEDLRALNESQRADIQKLDKSRKKLQGELDDIQGELEKERQQNQLVRIIIYSQYMSHHLCLITSSSFQ